MYLWVLYSIKIVVFITAELKKGEGQGKYVTFSTRMHKEAGKLKKNSLLFIIKRKSESEREDLKRGHNLKIVVYFEQNKKGEGQGKVSR